MTKTLGIIGSGMIGGAVARLAVDAGFEVIVSNSRGPETLSELVTQLGSAARAATPAEAASESDWTVVSVPFSAVPHLPIDALAGKLVIETNNFYRQRDGDIPEFRDGAISAGQSFSRQLPASRVVKAFNTIYFRHLLALSRPTGASDRTAIPIAGDDASAKREATSLIDQLGFDVVDIGGTDESWRIEEGSPAYVLPYLSDAKGQWTADPGAPVSADRLRAIVESARPRR